MFWRHVLAIRAWQGRVLLGFEAPGPGRAGFDLGKMCLVSCGLMEIWPGLPGPGRVAASLVLPTPWISPSRGEIVVKAWDVVVRTGAAIPLEHL